MTFMLEKMEREKVSWTKFLKNLHRLWPTTLIQPFCLQWNSILKNCFSLLMFSAYCTSSIRYHFPPSWSIWWQQKVYFDRELFHLMSFSNLHIKLFGKRQMHLTDIGPGFNTANFLLSAINSIKSPKWLMVYNGTCYVHAISDLS